MGSGNDLSGSRRDISVPVYPSMPTAFRLATESAPERERSQKENTDTTQEQGTENAFGVESLNDSMSCTPLAGVSKRLNDDPKEAASDAGPTEPLQPALETSAEEILKTSSMLAKEPSLNATSQRHSRQHSFSHSIASVSLDSQAPLSSLPSSPKSISNRSLRVSDEESVDDGGSQAIASSSEDESRTALHDSSPQLIMPSIKMPSRRPFTEKGRGLGRLKILFAGDSGVGKTSLIKSIVQTCEDIVHVDPIPTTSTRQKPTKKSKSGEEASSTSPTHRITEVYASTRPYPSWWAEVDETKLLHRRKSMGDMVLERNICFVDTPGYSHGMAKIQSIETVVHYMTSQLNRSFAGSSGADNDMAGLLSGNGGSQVDLVLYMISQELKQEDLMFFDRLSSLSNVIPLISKSDSRSPEEFEILRRSIHEQLKSANIRAFEPVLDGTGNFVYNVCSATSDDEDVMDASLLMSSKYIQPLLSSELGLLLQHIFEKDTISRMRHLASKKLLTALRSNAPAPTPKASAITPRSPGLSPYLQARITDHIQHEERLAQIKLAKWASDLQRSLQAERAQYEAMAASQRVGWLTDKLGECGSSSEPHQDSPSTSALVPVSKSKRRRSPSSSSPNSYTTPSSTNLFEAGDPLGLLRWNETLRHRGWLAFQVAGGFGILGAVAVWAAKAWGWSSSSSSSLWASCGCASGGSGGTGGGNDEERWVWNTLTGAR